MVDDQAALDRRARTILRSLVGQYIRDGNPVGSRSLARHSGLDVSAATIRNVMADLEEMGLLASPHTSAGRVPTVQGYRMFVDSLLTVQPMQDRDVTELQAQLSSQASTQDLVASASTLLSDLTQFVGLVTVPDREEFAFRHIDFVRIGERQVMAIVVFDDNEVQNRILETGRDFDQAEIERAANFLNQEYAGLYLKEIRERLVNDLETDRLRMDRLMRGSVQMASRAFETPETHDDVVVAGQTNLMAYNDLFDMGLLRSLFEAFTTKRDLLHLLEGTIQAEGVRLFIGSETGSEVLQSCSVVTAPYTIDDKVVGVLGVLGPTRMRYDRVIPLVDATARILGSALNNRG